MPPLEIVELPGLDVFEASLVGDGDNPPAKVCLVKHRRLNMAEQKKEADTKAKGSEVKEGFDFNAFMAALPLLSPDERKMLAAALSAEPAEVEAMNRKMETTGTDQEDSGDPPPEKDPVKQQWAAKAREWEARIKAAEEGRKAADLRLAAVEGEREIERLTVKARADFAAIPTAPEALAKMLHLADHGQPIPAADLRAHLTATQEALAQGGGIFRPAGGKGAPVSTGGMSAFAAAVAKAKAADPKLTDGEAQIVVARTHPDLYLAARSAERT